MLTRRTRAAGAAVIACVAAGVGIAGLANGTLASTSDNPGGTVMPSSDTAARATSQFSVLRRAQTPDDAIPAKWSGQASETARRSGAGSVDLSTARRVSLTAGKGVAWVAAGGGAICLLNQSGDAASLACGSDQDAGAGQTITTDSGVGFGLAEGQLKISGLLPDGAAKVRMATLDGAVQPIEVQDNVYSVVLSGQQPDRVEWTDATGATHSTHVPNG
jgi:hypothetical protein